MKGLISISLATSLSALSLSLLPVQADDERGSGRRDKDEVVVVATGYRPPNNGGPKGPTTGTGTR